ncbi:MAG: hypothetical protein ABR567_18985 [Myxococcales bacterium]
MRNIIIGAVALALGCATTGQQEQRSQAMSAQEQAHQSLQAAADAQKKASDEQAKAEKAQKDVEDAQRALADAQAKLRGQRQIARQAQQEAQRLNQEAQRETQDHQQQALQYQDQQSQQQHQLNQERAQSWTQEQTLSGRVVRKSGDQLRVRTEDQGVMNLDLSGTTAVSVDGRAATADQIQPGSDVRASYQMIDGKAKALKIDVTSNGSQQDQYQQQNQQQQPSTPH